MASTKLGDSGEGRDEEWSYDEWLQRHTPLPPGTRVRLRGRPIAVTLAVDTGCIVGPADWEGYYLVHLDQPGLYHPAEGEPEPLPKVVEAWDNLEVLEPATPRPRTGRTKPQEERR